MKSLKKYQLLAIDKFGKMQPVLDKPGQPVKLFHKKKDAVDFAEENPEYFRTGLYTVIEVMELAEEKPEPDTVEADKEEIEFQGEPEEV